jgi:ABC-2 type transport system permease protein
VVAFGIVLMLWLSQLLAYNDWPFAEVFGYVSLISHFDSLRRGIFNTGDVAYYVLLTSLFLWLTVQRLDVERG